MLGCGHGTIELAVLPRGPLRWILNSDKYGYNYPDGFEMEKDPCPELEEIISPRGTPHDELVMDYYIPIALKEDR